MHDRKCKRKEIEYIPESQMALNSLASLDARLAPQPSLLLSHRAIACREDKASAARQIFVLRYQPVLLLFFDGGREKAALVFASSHGAGGESNAPGLHLGLSHIKAGRVAPSRLSVHSGTSCLGYRDLYLARKLHVVSNILRSSLILLFCMLPSDLHAWRGDRAGSRAHQAS